jgi:hypothetical protein
MQTIMTWSSAFRPGYLMNTIELTSRLRFVAGVRFEATHVSTLSYDQNATRRRPA